MSCVTGGADRRTDLVGRSKSSGHTLTGVVKRQPTAVRAWLVLSVLLIGLSVALGQAGLPSPVLFGSLAAGLVYALSVPKAPAVPLPAFTVGQAIIGVSIGALFDPDTL